MLVALVVEDNVALRSAVARYLERKGWQIVSAANGLQGLEAVRRRSFDVVISDVNRSEEHTSELQSRQYLVCRLLLEKKKNKKKKYKRNKKESQIQLNKQEKYSK